MEITCNEDSVVITSDEYVSMDGLLDELNRCVPPEKYPLAWEYVMEKEQRESFFGLGSAQIFDMGWTFKYEVSDSGCKLTVEGLN